jgi:hypothetical protein
LSVAGTVDVDVTILGGLVTDIAPADLPHGVSPDCQDVQFQIGSVKTRPGVTALYTLIGNPTVNSLTTYETLTEIPRFVSLDSLGVLRKDTSPGGALATISNSILPNSFFKSCNLFGRQYFGFGNGTEGIDLPRQYDDANFDRISQVGPGAAPAVVDENVSFTIAAAGVPGAAMINAMNVVSGFEQGNLTTLVITFFAINSGNPPTLQIKAGDQFTVTGLPAGYNGTFAAAFDLTLNAFSSGNLQYYNPTSGLAPTGATANAVQFSYAAIQFTIPQTAANNIPQGASATISGVGVGSYNGTWRVAYTSFVSGNIVIAFGQFGIANSGGGTATIAGNIAAGKHQLSVIFVTRSGYYTKPAQPTTWIAGGGKRAIITGIPTGPPNIAARVLCFTGVNGASFYHLGPTGITLFSSNMFIADNVTTQIAIDFSDQLLFLGTLDDPLFNQIELPPVLGVIDYSNRLLAWGAQNNVQNMVNLTFDGGFGTDTLGNLYPLGWSEDKTNYTGGGSALTRGQTVVYGDAYSIAGDGATAIRGKITQAADDDYLENPVLLPNIAYTVRVRLAALNALAGMVHINLQSTSGAFTTVGISQAFNTLTGNYAVFTGNLTSGLATVPTDLLLQVYVDGTPNNGSFFLIDQIEIYPTGQQFANSTIFASKGQLDTQGQESFDSQTGLIQYNLNDGQSVRTCFKIRERLYIVKEHSFGVTQDDGVNEPADWTVDDVSKKVGTPSVNGVGIGEDWVVIAHRTGLYIYWGGGVEKISQEIQPLWDTINWQFGYTIAVTVDTRRRRIFICAPFGAATQPNKTLVLDYHDVGSGAAAIASSPPIHLTYTGKKTAFDKARKWAPWTIPANSVAQIEQANGTTLVYFGSNDATGRINQLDDTGTVFTDNGMTVPSFYTFSFFPEQPVEQAMKLGAHRKLFSYLSLYCQGSGTIGITVFLATLSNAIALNPQLLSNPATKDLEMMINQLTERMSLKISSGGNTQWFDLQRLNLNVRVDPWAVTRGVN